MKKILKAIQEGIKQSFILDDEIDDEKFVKSKVSSGIDIDKIQKQFEKLVLASKLSEANDFYNNYKYMLSPCKVKFKTLENINYIVQFYPYALEFLDMSENIVLIDKNNNEVFVHEDFDPSTISFIKITTDTLSANNDDILIWVDKNFSITSAQWQYLDESVIPPKIEKCKSTYDRCLKTDKWTKIKGWGVPALQQCLSINVKNGNIDYHGYLPSIQQLNVIVNVEAFIDNLFEKICQTQFDLSYKTFWSSNEQDKINAYCFEYYGGARGASKQEYHSVFPIFAIKKN